MEESRPLPAPEEAVPTEETGPTQLANLLTRFNKRTEAASDPPDVPPPFPGLENLLYEQAAEPAVDVSIEEVPDEAEAGSLEARQRLEEAYEAAQHEQDLAPEELPEEAKNERRAELMPEPDPVQETQRTAAAVGKVLADLHQKTAAAFAAFGRAAPSPSNLPLPAAFVALPALYKKSVLAGFGLAVAALVTIAILA